MDFVSAPYKVNMMQNRLAEIMNLVDGITFAKLKEGYDARKFYA